MTDGACLECGDPIYGRADRETCSSTCRQRRSRRLRGLAPGRRRVIGHDYGRPRWAPVVGVTVAIATR